MTRSTVSGYMIITIKEAALGVVVKGLKQNAKPGAAALCQHLENHKLVIFGNRQKDGMKNTFTNLSLAGLWIVLTSNPAP